jgi:short subunit dehydrogenase-like uncharacterized protein
MTAHALLYGANGYTGREVAERLAGAGVDLLLAGRDPERVRLVAEPLGLDWIAFDLTSADAIDAALRGAGVVLNAAGPFERTAAPMIAGCLRTGVHYLDLSGEWPALMDAMACDEAAKAAQIMIMPGVGLTIAATDCLLALAKARQPNAVKLRLGVSRPQVITRGTVATAATMLSASALIRRGGQLVTVPAGSLAHAFDFGDGLKETTAMSGADVVTGEFTTGVGDIEVYSELGWMGRASYRWSSAAMAVTGAGPWRSVGVALSAAWPEAPSAEERRRAAFMMVAEAVDPWRRVSRVRMRTLDGYTTSVLTAAAAVQRVMAGERSPGFQTPAKVFGADFILDLGCAALEGEAQPARGAA